MLSLTLLNLCGVVSYVELFSICPAIGDFIGHLLNITYGLQP